MKKIVLASASPRRRALLRQLGLKFIVDPGTGDEDNTLTADPHALTRLISRRKAGSVVVKYPDAVIIAADTIGVLEGQVLGKPESAAGAKKMLEQMSGKPHRVITGYTVLDTATGKTVSNSVETIVYIKSLSAAEIDAYVLTGEPLDKAGAYGIQGRGAVLVERIAGDYSNVVGLPLFALSETLKEFGIKVL